MKLNVMGADVVPMLLAVIQEHRNAGTRDKLTYALFNLVKKPTSAQRHLIADSCADLAGRIGASRTAEELLPQCWEQVGRLWPPVWLCVTCRVLAPCPAWQTSTSVARVVFFDQQGQLFRNEIQHLLLCA